MPMQRPVPDLHDPSDLVVREDDQGRGYDMATSDVTPRAYVVDL